MHVVRCHNLKQVVSTCYVYLDWTRPHGVQGHKGMFSQYRC
jgi:hypothetical protein